MWTGFTPLQEWRDTQRRPPKQISPLIIYFSGFVFHYLDSNIVCRMPARFGYVVSGHCISLSRTPLLPTRENNLDLLLLAPAIALPCTHSWRGYRTLWGSRLPREIASWQRMTRSAQTRKEKGLREGRLCRKGWRSGVLLTRCWHRKRIKK
jgi:hypothetical protein